MVTSSTLSGAGFLAVAGVFLIIGMIPAKQGRNSSGSRGRAARLAFVAVLLLAGVVTLFPTPAESAFLTQTRVWLELPARLMVQHIETMSPAIPPIVSAHAVTPLTGLMCAVLAFVLGGSRKRSTVRPARLA